MAGNAAIALDATDRRILAVVQSEGRITNQALSEAVGLSPSPCLRRMKAMEDAGVISRYVALVDPKHVGLAVTAFIRVRLDQQSDKHLDTFESQIVRFPEVMECYLMTGEADYQVRVLVEDLRAYEDFLRHKLTSIAGVSQITTSFAIRPVVYKTALPL